jgi:vancomycin resistance protein VanJ
VLINKVMRNIINSIYKSVARYYFVFLVIISFAVTILPWWPFYQWLLVPKYVLLFGPRWWLLLLCLLNFIFWRQLGKKSRFISPLLVITALNYLDFQLPSLTQYFQLRNVDNNSIKIINANVGGGSKYELQLLIKDEIPDILLLQEAKNLNFVEWLPPEYMASCDGGLCIVSKLDFEIVGKLSRKLVGGWGNFAMLYKIKTAQGEFSLANIHMETPRDILMNLTYLTWGQSSAAKIESDREYEALLITSWQKEHKKFIIAGDFNMFEDENIYRKHFSPMMNALGVATTGLNYTKKTSFYGARIDHLLFSKGFALKDARVIDSIMGDHKPVVSILYQVN